MTAVGALANGKNGSLLVALIITRQCRASELRNVFLAAGSVAYKTSFKGLPQRVGRLNNPVLYTGH